MSDKQGNRKKTIQKVVILTLFTIFVGAVFGIPIFLICKYVIPGLDIYGIALLLLILIIGLMRKPSSKLDKLLEDPTWPPGKDAPTTTEKKAK